MQSPVPRVTTRLVKHYLVFEALRLFNTNDLLRDQINSNAKKDEKKGSGYYSRCGEVGRELAAA